MDRFGLPLLLLGLPRVSGHAYVYWPASRNLQVAPHIAHCFNVPGPPVAFESAHNAGGKAGPSDFARGMCGNFGQFAPKDTIAEDGIANWAEAAPVATYAPGSTITFTIVNNAEHGGHYEFRLCDRKLDASIGGREEAARCFDAHFLGRQCVPQCGCDSDRCKAQAEHNSPEDPIYAHGPPQHLQQGGHQVEVTLPPGLSCETCTIQWFWHTAWGEQFWNCIDVRIQGGLNPTLPPLTTLVPATTTPTSGGGGGGKAGPCVWTTPPGREVQLRKQSEKPGRICWELTVPLGTTVHYQAEVDIYHTWNTATCCLSDGGAAAGAERVVSFTPEWGSFGFCACVGWTPSTGGTTCAGQATPANMICPVPGGAGSMCVAPAALAARPSECGRAPTTSPPPPGSTTGQPLTTSAPGGLPLPQSCTAVCGRTPSAGSCALHGDELSCTSHYHRAGDRIVPCSWTACGECFADGAGLLECPDLETECSSGCGQLCGKVDLAATARSCGALSHDRSQCERSFFSKAGRSMPCKWTGCSCFADGETLLECGNLHEICPPSLLVQ